MKAITLAHGRPSGLKDLEADRLAVIEIYPTFHSLIFLRDWQAKKSVVAQLGTLMTVEEHAHMSLRAVELDRFSHSSRAEIAL